MVISTFNGEPWLQKSFLKDSGKLRSRERYWHTFRGGNGEVSTTEEDALIFSPNRTGALSSVVSSDAAAFGSEDHSVVVAIPDAVCLRKYLRLFKHILTYQQDYDKLQISFIVLLESVVDYMDYRNQAPVIKEQEQRPNRQQPGQRRALSEMAATQERSSLQKLMREGKIIPFCDLSIREEQHDGFDSISSDEWNWLAYESLSMEERSQYALVRAARLLLDKRRKIKWVNGHSNGEVIKQGQIKQDSVIILVDEISIAGGGTSGPRSWNTIHLDEGVQVQRLESFFQSFIPLVQPDRQEPLLELLQSCQIEYQQRNLSYSGNQNEEAKQQGDSVVQDYWSDERLAEGMRKGEVMRGRINFTKENPKEAFVRADGKHWFIDARRGNHNRAIDQDVVIIQPLTEEKWGRPVGRRRLVFRKDGDDDDNDEFELGDLSFPTFPSAKVVSIEATSRRSFVATLVDTPLPEESAFLLVPMDIRIPKIRVPSRSWQKLEGMRLLVQVDGWDVGSNYPHGHVFEVLGPIGDLESEIKCLLCENQIRLDPFSVAACACLPKEGSAWTVNSIPESELNQRRDLRKTHRIFSVDPIGCQDIDDTMHARYLPSGDIEFGVHIADVTWFVPLDSALDREARLRGTTFYLVDRRFDMLPGLLSSNLCSLHDNTDRLAVSVIWTISSDMETIKSTWFGRTIIHNVAAMTYEQAANILDGKKPENENQKLPPPFTAGSPVNPDLIPFLKDDLSLLTKMARLRRKHREDFGGAVDLSSGDLGGELKFTLVNGKPVSVKPKQDLEIHHTIAELMIWANTSVANKIFEHFPGSSLLRIHREVEEDRFDDLKEMLSAGKVNLKGKSNKELSETLKKAGHQTVPVVASLFRSLATRAMSEAQYVSSGNTKDRQNLSHFGLGLSFYTHFTSPIRRYADVVVHHQLMAALDEAKPLDNRIADGVSEVAPTLPNSEVVSMLTGTKEDEVDHDWQQQATCGLESGISEPFMAEDVDIDNLIEGAQDLVIGDLANKKETADNRTSDVEDVEIDALIGEASTLMIDGIAQSGKDEPHDDGGNVKVGLPTVASPLCAPEDLEIDELIGDASAFLAGVEDLPVSKQGLVDDPRSKTRNPSRAVNPPRGKSGKTESCENSKIDQVLGDDDDLEIEGCVRRTSDLVGTAAGEQVATVIPPDEHVDPPTKGETNTSKRSGASETLAFDRSLPSSASTASEHRAQPFTAADVSTISERLNLHTRLAKQCSFECQSLFLSLFFRDHVEVAEAVVAKLKENGFEAYIPRFDLRAPVYLRDSDGYVQMDPLLLGLPIESGENATMGFSSSSNCRRFRREEVELQFTPGEELAVLVKQNTRMTLRSLDVVSVEIFCSDWDQRARIPAPRVHLVPSHHEKASNKRVPEVETETRLEKAPPRSPLKSKVASPTIFDVVESAIKYPQNLAGRRLVRLSPETNAATVSPSTRIESLKGRIVFGNFVNPNTKMAEQLVAQEAAAADALQRRQNMVSGNASRRRGVDEDTVARRIAREVTSRQQRLAKEKRESRRPKKN
ncbi:hypothetical protein ACA910_014557 [Epithemia clementina (nom. ined.)]